MAATKENPITMEIMTDPVELAKAKVRDELFQRNLSWFQVHAPEIYVAHRGKCICISGEELFVADSPNEVLALAKAAIRRMRAVLPTLFRWKGWRVFMLLNGMWLLCDDGVIRPVIYGEALAKDGTRLRTPFLVDTAADRTVFSANILEALGFEAVKGTQQLGGVGGVTATVAVATRIEFPRDDVGRAVFKGQFAAFTDKKALDMSVLGRDILNLFTLIADRQGDRVCLLGQDHYYTIGKR